MARLVDGSIELYPLSVSLAEWSCGGIINEALVGTTLRSYGRSLLGRSRLEIGVTPSSKIFPFTMANHDEPHATIATT